jgi:hypothetical protein
MGYWDDWQAVEQGMAEAARRDEERRKADEERRQRRHNPPPEPLQAADKPVAATSPRLTVVEPVHEPPPLNRIEAIRAWARQQPRTTAPTRRRGGR